MCMKMKELHAKQGEVRSSDKIVDTGVGYDGIWLIRGHKSQIGAGFVMDMDSGFVGIGI